MNFKPLTQLLSNNQKEIIAGVFLLLSVIIPTCKETPPPAPTPAPTTINITLSSTPATPVAPAAPDTVVYMHHYYYHYDAPRPCKTYHKPRRKPGAKPQPSCPCADSAKAGS
jgi:hypothetical protein